MSKLENLRICDLAHEWALKNHRISGAKPQVIQLEETESTNSLAKENRYFGQEQVLFLAHHQSGGRGRGQNQWQDSRGQQLLSSWSFYLEKAPQPILSILVGLKLYQSCRQVWPNLPWSLKVPNDLLVAERKIAGLLIETVSQQGYQLILGLGMNFLGHPDPQSQSITQPIISLSELTEFKREEFESFLNHFYIQILKLSRENPTCLSFQDREDLLAALNANHRLSEPYQSIDECGSLTTSTRTFHWSEI